MKNIDADTTQAAVTIVWPATLRDPVRIVAFYLSDGAFLGESDAAALKKHYPNENVEVKLAPPKDRFFATLTKVVRTPTIGRQLAVKFCADLGTHLGVEAVLQ